MGHRKLFPGFAQYNRYIKAIGYLIKDHGWWGIFGNTKGIIEGFNYKMMKINIYREVFIIAEESPPGVE